MIDFDIIFAAFTWNEIENCPGRYVLAGGANAITLKEIIGTEYIPVNPQHSNAAIDPVLICKIKGGGMITYQKKDGGFLHTLCTEDGFKRKIQQLELSPGEEMKIGEGNGARQTS